MKSVLSCRAKRPENEASHRLYRIAWETAQRLDHNLSQISNFSDLFSPDITDQRNRLKDYCERLMFSDPSDYGKKTEDLLWRKVYYEFFQKCKHNKKKILESEVLVNILRSHLLAAVGFYHHLLFRVQTEFHLDLSSKVELPFLWNLRGIKKERWKKCQSAGEDDDQLHTWANQACHRILTYLGDLARYAAELQPKLIPEFENSHLAERYYLQAFCLNPKNGMPHNQLGSLADSTFDSAYHYMRCLSSVKKFSAAEDNLLRTFQRNDKVVEEMDVSESMSCSSKFLARFLKLCEIFYFSSDENLQTLCQDALQDFDQCMPCNDEQNLVDPKHDENILEDEVIFKVTVMCIICITKLHEKENSDVSLATAFSLSLFSSIIHYTTKTLTYDVYERVEEKVEKSNKEAENNENSSPEDHIAKKTVNAKNKANEFHQTAALKRSSEKKSATKKLNASNLRKLRRRRKISSTSQDDSELSDAEVLELAESDDENGMLNSYGSQNNSCSSESLSECEEEELISLENNNLGNENQSLDCSTPNVFIDTSDGFENLPRENDSKYEKKNNETPDEQTVKYSEKILPVDHLTKAIGKNKLLQSIKVIVDFMKLNSELLPLCVEHLKLFFTWLIDLFNLLLKLETKFFDCKEDFTRLKRAPLKWVQPFPLPEDILLQGLPVFESLHSQLSFEVRYRRELHLSEQAFLRLQCLLYFADVLSADDKSLVLFDKDKKQYYLKLCEESKKVMRPINENSSPVVEVKDDIETQRQQLMQEMAHLWLKSEVNSLEKSIRSSSSPQLSPILVPDASALCQHLFLLKQLVATKSFVVIVPKSVIANLDQEKKKSGGAREAIRWLEFVFKKRNRCIRPQRESERCSVNPIKYPKHKDKEAWDFFQILECCNFLCQQQSADTSKSSCSFITLVVGTHNQLPSNAAALARSLNVSMENLESFFSKWHTSVKKPG